MRRRRITADSCPPPAKVRHESPLARLASALLLAATIAAAPAAIAQPTGTAKPIHIVVTFTPGGAPDILARLIAEKLSADWSQPVMVDNKPGAGGNTAPTSSPRRRPTA